MSNCPICAKWQDEPLLRIVELEICYVSLNRDQFFPGYVFVFTKRHVTELFHLDRTTREAMMEEVNSVAEALYSIYKPDKINYELLGNMAPHMHWHLIPRFRGEPLWPRPIWSETHGEVIMSPEAYTERIESIRNSIRIGNNRDRERN
jgi:diadenosine tetraphosphate (Ap4A) HIT family hydrolase